MSNARELPSWVYLAFAPGEVPSSTLRVAVAAFGDISRFKPGDAAASYLGLTPSTRQSATSVYHGPITKHGNSTARYMLFQAAQQYARQPGPLGCFFQRLKRRKNHNVAVVTTARKLAVIAWRLLTPKNTGRQPTVREIEE